MDQVYWITTVEGSTGFDNEKAPLLNRPISKKEILLSELIGKPYPTYIVKRIYRLST